MSSAEQVARNEGVFRAVNEQIDALVQRQPFDHAEFVCECGRLGCHVTVPIALAAYELVRSHPRRFLVAPGHDDPRFEVVIERTASYAIVEKRGRAGDVAAADSPR